MLAGEHAARTAAADGDFVGDEQNFVPPRKLSQPTQVARRMYEHAGRGLHERFDDDGRDLLMPLGQHALDIAQIMLGQALGRHAGWPTIDERRGHANHIEQQRLEHRVEPRHAPHADAAQRVAMIGVGQCKVARFARRGSFRCRQYWKAIFNATSTLAEPSLEKKT